MRRLTFTGYLKRYCCELAGDDTQSMFKLCNLAATNSPRITEPLFLLVAMNGKVKNLLAAAKATRLEKEYTQISISFPTASHILRALEENDKQLPVRYHKVYRSYLSRANRIKTDRDVSLLMREKTLAAMREKKLSKYRIYTDLELNPGNINAFLKYGDATKVSRDTARAIMEYALNFSHTKKNRS
ncbi:MAG: hypothetical protein LBG97_00825 [Coriobacteriales bacterium]|jgi:hypothetical protein|nr:hypothetical protein [Coriobacteriales bacterium]